MRSTDRKCAANNRYSLPPTHVGLEMTLKNPDQKHVRYEVRIDPQSREVNNVSDEFSENLAEFKCIL